MAPTPALTSTAALARGTAWNIAGRLLPLGLALVATPLLVQALGLARWGLFALALSLGALFGVFDLGVGRALTRGLAVRLAAGDRAGAASDARTGVALLAALGAAAGLGCAAGAWAYAGVLDLPPALREEARWAFLALSAAAPLVLVNAGLWGVLAAHQRFAGANLVNLPIMAAYYLGPLAVLRAWDSLIAATLVLVACRAVMTWAYWRLCLRALPELATALPRPGTASVLLRQGGWMTVSTVLAPAAQHLDRFVIAARLSTEAAALYATPFDVVIRIAVLGQAVLASAFPAMAAALAADTEAAARLFRHATLAILALVLPPCLACLLFADLLLVGWLGAGFADAVPAARILSAGVVLFALDGVAAALIDGAARAARNALLAVAELAVYLPALVLALGAFGIVGAASVWAMRMLAVGAVRLALAQRAHAGLAVEVRALAPCLAATLGALAVALAGAELPPLGRLVLLPTLLTPVALLAWRYALPAAERAALLARVARRPRTR